MTTPRWRALSSSDSTTARWRLDLAYDGRGLNGFALQPDAPTVVGLLRETMASTLQLAESPCLTGAGRTDAGVHAHAQVVSVDLPDPLFGDEERGPERLRRALNHQLAGRIVVHAVRQVSPDFDARHSAQWRAYRYLLVEGERPALASLDELAWTVDGPLDLVAMNEVAQSILGEHDFRSFCRRPVDKGPDDPLRRRVLAAEFSRVGDPAGVALPGASLVRLDIRAQSFCHNMVRSLVGAFVAVGQGRLGPEVVTERLNTPNRANLPAPAPAAGLCLVGVGYPQVDGGPSGFLD